MIKLKSVKKSGSCEIYSIQKDGVEIGAVQRVTINQEQPQFRSTCYSVYMGVSPKRFHPTYVLSWQWQHKPSNKFETKSLENPNKKGCWYESAWVARKRLMTWLNDEYACIEQTNNQ